MTHAEEIMRAVAMLVKSGRTSFSRKNVRDQLGLNRKEWVYCYGPIFQGMREQPGKAPRVDERFKGVFRRVRYGRYVLTPKGEQLAREFVC